MTEDHQVRFPKSNSIQKQHDALARENIIKIGSNYPDNASIYFENIEKNITFKLNYNVIKSITRIASLYSHLSPNRTHMRYLNCTFSFINQHWNELAYALSTLEFIKQYRDEKDIITGYEIKMCGTLFKTNKKGLVKLPINIRAAKRNLKKEIDQCNLFDIFDEDEPFDYFEE